MDVLEQVLCHCAKNYMFRMKCKHFLSFADLMDELKYKNIAITWYTSFNYVYILLLVGRSSYNQENINSKELLHAVYIVGHFKIHMN